MAQRQGVVVVAWPRTGSTLTLGLLNAIPGTHVVGEWWLPWVPLVNSVHRLDRWRGEEQAAALNGTRWPHHGLDSVDREEYATDLAMAVRRQMLRSASDDPPPVTLGFKENNWASVKPRMYPRFTEMLLRTLGEDTLFVLLDRNLRDASASRGNDIAKMRARRRPALRYQSWLAENGYPVLKLRYKQFTDPDTDSLLMTLREIFSAVADRDPSAPELEAMLTVANTPHSSAPRHASAVIQRRVQAGTGADAG